MDTQGFDGGESLTIGEGISDPSTTFELSYAPLKKRTHPEILTKSIAECCTANFEVSGDNGYVYSIGYGNGCVTLAVCASDAPELKSEAKIEYTLGLKDWHLFRAVACKDLDNPGFPEMIYVTQWDSYKEGKIFRVEADRFNRSPEEFIFLRVCDEKEKFVATRGRAEWSLKPFPVSTQEYEEWFKNAFFIQWCDWEILKKHFDTIDYVIRRDSIRTSYEKIKKRLIFDDCGHQALLLPRPLYRPKIVNHRD